jgi:hypothetical protein
MLSFFYGLPFIFCHKLREIFISFFFDHGNTSWTVGAENYSKELRNEIIIFGTILNIAVFFAIGTTLGIVFHVAVSYFTPCCLAVLMTAGAFSLKV